MPDIFNTLVPVWMVFILASVWTAYFIGSQIVPAIKPVACKHYRFTMMVTSAACLGLAGGNNLAKLNGEMYFSIHLQCVCGGVGAAIALYLFATLIYQFA